MKLKNTLRYLRGEDLITHLGRGVLRLMDSGRLQPAFYGGLLIGVLGTADRERRQLLLLPLGRRRRHAGGLPSSAEPPFLVTSAEGALVGLLAGVIGAIIGGLISIPSNQ